MDHHLKSPDEIEKMRSSGRIAKLVIDTVRSAAQPGMTTGELEDIAVRVISDHGATSPCLGYTPPDHPPYPSWSCVCVNDEIVHGIPGSKLLKNGDVVTIDTCVELNGYIADTAYTFGLGKISIQADKLLKITEEALYKGIEKARPGSRFGDIGYAIQKFVESHGYSVVRELHGHGVGYSMHEPDIDVPNYGRPGKGKILECGMTFAIEPMVNIGKKDIRVLPDGWTITTADRSLSAHFEHTVAILPKGVDILTE